MNIDTDKLIGLVTLTQKQYNKASMGITGVLSVLHTLIQYANSVDDVVLLEGLCVVAEEIMEADRNYYKALSNSADVISDLLGDI